MNASLHLWYLVLAIIATTSLVSVVVEAKECRVVTRGKELKALIQRSHVLVALIDEDEDEDKDDVEGAKVEGTSSDATAEQAISPSKELCQRLAATPETRAADFELVLVSNAILQRKVYDSSRTLPTSAFSRLIFHYRQYMPQSFVDLVLTPASQEPLSFQTPLFVLFLQGSSYEHGHGLQFPNGINTEDAPATADRVSHILSMWLRRQKLGSYVYSMATYDVLAAQLVQWVKKYGPSHILTQVWVHVVVRGTQYLVQPSMLPFEQELAQFYIKCCSRIAKNGLEMIDMQIGRLERLLDDGDGHSQISPFQREKLNQKLYIWKRFQQPVEITSKEAWMLVGRLVMNVISLIGIAVLIPLLLLGSSEDVEEGVNENLTDDQIEMHDNHEDANDKRLSSREQEPHGDTDAVKNNSATNDSTATAFSTVSATAIERSVTTSRSTTTTAKQENLIFLKERARRSMEADKRRVEAIKFNRDKTQSQSPRQLAENTTMMEWTEEELNTKTVAVLKEYLKERHLPISGKKAMLVDRLLSYQYIQHQQENRQ